MQSLLKVMNRDLQGLWIARLARDPLLVCGLFLPVWCVGARTRFLMTCCTIPTFVNVFAGNGNSTDGCEDTLIIIMMLHAQRQTSVIMTCPLMMLCILYVYDYSIYLGYDMLMRESYTLTCIKSTETRKE